MRRVIVAVVVLVGCSAEGVDLTSSTSTTQPTTTTTAAPTASSTTHPRPIGGHLVKLDMNTLAPVSGLEPIPIGRNSWSLTSEDGTRIVIFEYSGEILDSITTVDVGGWETLGSFEARGHSARLIHDDMLVMYDDVSGNVTTMDLSTGEVTKRGEWRRGLWMWDELHVLPSGWLVGLGSASSDVVEHVASYSVFLLDPVTGMTEEIEIGSIERITENTGTFDGDYEVPEFDSPGVVWGDDRLFIVHADGPDVTVADVDTGEVETHVFDTTSWLDRTFAYWIPAASAKGPSLGTSSSAALSPDGRYLFISGNRHVVVENAAGTLIEESQHLGVTVVDTETWQIVDRPDLPVQFVRSSHDYVMGVDTRSTSPWIDDLYLLTVDEDGAALSVGPFTVEEGACEVTHSHDHLICSEYVSDTLQRIRVSDMTTSQVVATLEIGQEDYLHPNWVLVDWNPTDTSLGD